MKILLLGGAGSMAWATMNDFLSFDSGELKELIIADLSYEKLKKRSELVGDSRVIPMSLDCSNSDELVKAMGKVDVVVNSLAQIGDIPFIVLNAALKAKVHVIDLGAWSETTRECMKLSNAFKDAGITGILGLGSSPGIMNLITMAIANRLDIVEDVNLYFAYASLGSSTLPFKVPFFGALDEFIATPEIYKNGEYVKLDPMSGLEDIYFPQPIGMRRSFYIPHPEIATLPMVLAEKGLKHLGIKAGFTPDFFEKTSFMASIGLIAETPIKIGDKEIVPMEMVRACVDNLPPDEGDIKDYGVSRVVVTGSKAATKMKVTAEMMCYPFEGLTSAQHRTGHSPAIGARLLYRGDITKRGVFAPEAVVPLEPFFKELARRELEVEISSVEYI